MGGKVREAHMLVPVVGENQISTSTALLMQQC